MIRPLHKRFGEHRNPIEQGKDKHSVPRHFLEFHDQSSIGLRVWILEAIPNTFPPAEWYKKLCERENYWIYTLDTLSPGGLNETIKINTLLWFRQYTTPSILSILANNNAKALLLGCLLHIQICIRYISHIRIFWHSPLCNSKYTFLIHNLVHFLIL